MSYSNSLEKVRLDIDGPIATVSLERPNKLNALYPEMILRLVDVIEQVRRNNSMRVMVLRGEGRAFCAGDDPLRKTALNTGHQTCRPGCAPVSPERS